MGVTFEWDAKKERANFRKHGIDFTEAATVFSDPFSITIHDEPHSEQEERLLTIGNATSGRSVVAHTEREYSVRIISARLATPNERKQYEEGD